MGWIACTPRLVIERFTQTEPVAKDRNPDMPQKARPGSHPPFFDPYYVRWEDYVPSIEHPEDTPMRLIRVNFHILDNTRRNAHRPPDSTKAYLRTLLRTANADLDTNVRNWRSPEGTPVLPKRYRYVLTPQPKAGDDGFYFHYDDALCYFVSQGLHQNNYSTAVIDKYAIGMDTILNIFVLVHHPDSVRSKTYKSGSQGIALGNALKMAGLLESKQPAHDFRGLFNHEVGHIFYLGHAWVEDGCPDTPNHENRCWAWTPEGYCRDNATNNMMDYNAEQIAMTPCQIGRVHAVLASQQSALRRTVIPTWCTYRIDQTRVIRDSVHWVGDRDLEGDVIVADGASLHLSGRLSMPPGGKIVVEPGGKLWLDGCQLHNACQKEWDGVLVQQRGQRKGQVTVLKPAEMLHLRPERNTRRPNRQ